MKLVIFVFIGIICGIPIFRAVQRKKMIDFLNERSYWSKMNELLWTIFENNRFENEYLASRQLVSNYHSQKTIDYLCKYFGLKVNNDTVQALREMANLVSECEEYASKNQRLVEFFMQNYLPFYRMKYVSPAGRSTEQCEVRFTSKNITAVADAIEEKQHKIPKIVQERNKLTPVIREAVLARDNFTCCICGNSQYSEPNLLLEVDHIVPISKGGKTEPNNLQTLCWKCNRAKADSI